MPRDGTRSMGRASGSVSQQARGLGHSGAPPSLRRNVSIPVWLTPLKPETSVKSTLGFFGPQQQKPSSDLQSIDGVVPTSRPKAKREAPAISQGSSRASVVQESDAVVGRATMNRFCAVLGATLTFGFNATPACHSEQLPSPLIVTQVAPGVFVHIGDKIGRAHV